MNPTMSPPLSTSSRKKSRRSSSISSIESFDSDFFDQTYVPLSNLPTPPLSSRRDSYDTTTAQSQSPISLFSSEEILVPEFLGVLCNLPIPIKIQPGSTSMLHMHAKGNQYLQDIRLISLSEIGPAIHLTNLIPSSVSLTTPSVPLVHALLSRADLPIEILALAVAILDSLNSRFALTWRLSYPLESNEDQLLPQFEYHQEFPLEVKQEQHIDSTHPEVIILAALILATKFIDDSQGTTLYYAQKWGRGVWSCDQINFTQRAVLENLGYRLLSLWCEGVIEEAKRDMARAAKRHSSASYSGCMRDWSESMRNCGMVDGIVVGVGADSGLGKRGGRPMSSGKACLGMEGENTPQPTPVETPFMDALEMGMGLGMGEKPMILGGTSMLSRETKRAFGGLMGENSADWS